MSVQPKAQTPLTYCQSNPNYVRFAQTLTDILSVEPKPQTPLTFLKIRGLTQYRESKHTRLTQSDSFLISLGHAITMFLPDPITDRMPLQMSMEYIQK